MQVDVPPWVTQWLSAAEWRRRQRERDRRMPGLTLYAYGPYGRDPPNPVQPIFRIGGFPEQRDGVVVPRFGAGAAAPGAAAAGAGGWVPLHYPLDPFLAHNPNDLSHLGINMHGTRPQRVNVEWLPPPTAPGIPLRPTPDGGLLSGRAALRAWVFGSALLVLVLVLVRAIDKCLTVNLLKSRRRSQEWPTPNVRATSRQEADISTVMMPDSDDEPRAADYSDVLSVDLPPPYSECTAMIADSHLEPSTSGHKLPGYEDPPPAYSDTYVEFSNKNGVPSVLIYSRRRTPLVNRRDIDPSEPEVIDDRATSSEQNAQNNGTDINRTRAHSDVSDEARQRENTDNVNQIETSRSNNDTLHYAGVHSQNSTINADNRIASSSQTADDVEGDINKDAEIMV